MHPMLFPASAASGWPARECVMNLHCEFLCLGSSRWLKNTSPSVDPLSPAYVRGRGRKTARSRPLSHDIVLAKNSPLRCCLDMKTTSSTALRRETHIAIAWHPMPVSTGRRMNILEKHLAKCGKYVVFPS